MEIQTLQKHCILIPLSPKLDEYQVARLEEEIKTHPDLTVGIDLSFVEDCTIEFFEAVKLLKAGIFNIHSDIFSLFNMMNLDKSVALYSTEEDFLLDRHRLLNRKFSVVKTTRSGYKV